MLIIMKVVSHPGTADSSLLTLQPFPELTTTRRSLSLSLSLSLYLSLTAAPSSSSIPKVIDSGNHLKNRQENERTDND